MSHSVIPYEDYVIKVAVLNGKMIDYVYTKRDFVPDRADLIDTYKVICGKGVSKGSGKGSNVVTNINLLSPGEICNASFGLLYTANTLSEAQNAMSYVKTRLFRFLVSLLCDSGVNGISQYRFGLVPLQDFSHPWADQMLYDKYGLSPEEIEYIENTIKPME